MTNSVLVVVDSKDMSANSSSTSDFAIYYANNQILTRIKSFFVKSVSVPNVEYNIHGTYSLEPSNNILQIETTDAVPITPTITVTTITVTPGQYTLAQLITAITGSAGGVTLGLGITQSALTGKLTFTTTNVNGMKIYNYAAGSTIAPNLGISTTTAAYSASVLADGLPFLAGNQNIYISSKALASTSSLIDARIGNLQVITTVPVDVAYGSYIHYETEDYEKDMLEAYGYFNLREIDVKLYGDFGQLLDLQGLPFTMILKCYYDP